MRIDYRLKDGHLLATEPGRGNVVIYANPSAEEKETILATLPIERHTLESMLDPDEISRAEFDGDANIIIWKRAAAEFSGHYPVGSVGLILQGDHLTVIERDESPLPGDTEHTRPQSLNELVLRGMQASVIEFIRRLRVIKETARDVQQRLTKTIDNSELLRMFDLSEKLVFAIDAVDSNAVVLQRIAAAAPKLGFAERELDLLDEIIIDNEQLSRQGNLYISIFSGLMDARGSIVNNNMNVLLKNLTLVNIVFLPLGVIAGIGGMSEFSHLLELHQLPFLPGYAGFTVLLMIAGVLLWLAIRYWITKMMEAQ